MKSLFEGAFTQQAPRVIAEHSVLRISGRINKVTGSVIEARIPNVSIGEIVCIETRAKKMLGEVIGLRDSAALIMPFEGLSGVAAGMLVSPHGHTGEVDVSEALVGRVVDAFCRPLDGGPPIVGRRKMALHRPAPATDARTRIHERIETGVRVLDGLLTFGRGQRVGLFAGAGVGKTVLMRQLTRQTRCPVKVVALVGERGGEVNDLVAMQNMQETVVVVATSDRSPLERVRAALTATAISEYFADGGLDVLLVIDSLTRFAMALRELGLAGGELPATKGYPPSVFAELPRLLERAAPFARGGSITGLFTVLVEGDDLSDPVADSARSLLDGHIVLSRALASRGQFPAVDVLASASRVMTHVCDDHSLDIAQRARSMLAIRSEAEELRSLGAYTPGQNPQVDHAVAVGERIEAWIRQGANQFSPARQSIDELARILETPVEQATAKAR